MNKNDLAALAALGAMGYMYMNRDKGGPGGADSGVGAGGMRSSDVVYGGGAGAGSAGSPSAYSIGPGAAGAAGSAAGAGAGSPSAYSGGPENFTRGGNEQRYRGRTTGGGSRIGSNAAANMNAGVGQRDAGYGDIVPASELGSQSFPSNLPPPAAQEDTGISDMGAGLGAAGVGAAATAAAYARHKAQMRAAEEARASRVAETKRGILADRAQAQVDADRAARTQAEDRAAAQEQARAAAEERAAMNQEIERGLRKGQTKAGPGAPDRSAVLNKDAWQEGPSTDKKITTLGKTTVSETPAQTKTRNTGTSTGTSTGTGRGGQGGASSAEMDEFNKMLREKTVGTTAKEAGKTVGTTAKEAGKIKASGAMGKAGLALTALGLGSAAKAAVDMTPQERKQLANDVALGLVTPWWGMAEGANAPTMYDQSKSGRPATAAEIVAEKKKPGFFDFSSAAGMKRGGQTKAKKMASGGMTSKASSASKRGDGIASKGKTNCKMY